ncbi:hypothetical protein LIER_06507 [Lithospermum erythrorhizon]|uniref:Uncharacterized protein n=1 Tax=Lithospermum erythrorhizon TaxID=34254 RepID=A0AAV3P5U0_LITER
MEEKSTDSWVWRKFQRLRVHIKPHINIRIGDGNVCNFLFDNWHRKGPLQEISSMRLKLGDTMAGALKTRKHVIGRRATPSI